MKEQGFDLPGFHGRFSTLFVGSGAMTLIAEKEGHEVARIQGPYRTSFVLEYQNPETGQATRLSRSKIHVLRSIAERVFPELVWKD